MKCVLFISCYLLVSPGVVDASPYLPKSDAELLETLPARDETDRRMRDLQSQIRNRPNDWQAVQRLTTLLIERGRATSDPRYFGYAEANLQPWLNAATPHPQALILHATLLQNRHAFAPALQALDQALALQPRSGLAWLSKAAIQQVQGNFTGAWQSCLAARRGTPTLTANACLAATLSMTGRLKEAQGLLQQTLAGEAEAPVADRQWAWTMLAEIDERLGDPAAAEVAYRQALAFPQASAYLLSTYADFLLQQQRYPEVIDLLKGETRADGLLLRLALAERRLQRAEASEHVQALQARFAAGRLRGETSHQAEEARFYLELAGNPAEALRLAEANWAVQREPRDALIFLQAAKAAAAPARAAPVLRFIAESGVQDARLQALANTLGARS
ncbi:hypothetical protein [Methylomonas sp. HYX-M1]|uniref:hypothetical protein n=1 Tax=Methylomonas sp. HYX-M1 TaxID=3139307 RepID=UPI00345C0695